MQRVEHDGRVTAYRHVDRVDYDDRGSHGGGRDRGRSPILCVHGSGGTHHVWRSQLSRLSDMWAVAALDLSGHGGSDDIDADPGPETLRAYARDVLAVAAEVDARVLVGNSLGGAVVLTALLDGDLDTTSALDLDAVVLAGSGAKLAVLDDLLDWLANDFDRAIDFLHGDDRLFHDPDPRLVEGSKEAMRDAGQAVVERDFRSCHTFDIRGRLDEIGVPVLALTGEHDRLTPPKYHEYLAEHVPDGEWATVPDAAHLAMLENPEEWNAVVREFLDARGL